MMRAKCPRGHQITLSDINIEQRVVLCRECQTLHPVADVGISRRMVDALGAAKHPPPAGCSRLENGGEVHLTASARWLLAGLFALSLAVFWNGFFAYQLDSHVHDLRAAMGGQQSAASPMTTWMTIGGHAFFAVIILLFLLAGGALLGVAAILLAGRVEVRLTRDSGCVFTGVWKIGRSRRFDPRMVQDVLVREHVRDDGEGTSRHYSVRLVTDDKPLDFGRVLREPQFDWLAGSVHAELVPCQSKRAHMAS